MLSIEIEHLGTASGAFPAMISRKIPLAEGIIAIVHVSASDRTLREFVEKTATDLFLGSVESRATIGSGFAFVLERLNRAMREVAHDFVLEDLRVFLGVVSESTLHFSILGDIGVYLAKGSSVKNIAEGMGSADIAEFSYVSSGAIAGASAVFVSRSNFETHFSSDDLLGIARLAASNATDATRALLSRQLGQEAETEVIILAPKAPSEDVSHSAPSRILAYGSQLWEHTKDAYAWVDSRFHTSVYIQAWWLRFKALLARSPWLRTGLFLGGAVVSLAFLFLIVSSILSSRVASTVPAEYKNRLIEARLLIERANRDVTANPQAFRDGLKKAEELLFTIREQQLFTSDVKKALEDISVLKKQMNGVETFHIAADKAEYLFTTQSGSQSMRPLAVFEQNKQLYVVGKTQVVGPYVKGAVAQPHTLPDGEEAISATMDGSTVYILTASNRVIRYNKGQFSYSNVAGQPTWESANRTYAFNGNLYLLTSKSGSQLSRHRPAVNGFSARSDLLSVNDAKSLKVLDVAIDGGFYLLKDDLTLDKVFTTPTYSKRSILLNKLPEEGYRYDPQYPAQLALSDAGFYLYMLVGNSIWVFEPDSKRFQDIKSIRYIGQIQSDGETLRSIFAPRDGMLVVATDSWVYRIEFQVADGKLRLK